MDAQRSRRTRDQARKSWYAHYRQIRFARWFGFIEADADLNLLFKKAAIGKGPTTTSADDSDQGETSDAMLLDVAVPTIS
jgi:hypothetical protein